MRRAWGSDFAARVHLGTYAAKQLGWLDTLRATSQRRNPAVVRGLAKLGALMAADAEMQDSTSDYHARDPERRQAAIARGSAGFASRRRGGPEAATHGRGNLRERPSGGVPCDRARRAAGRDSSPSHDQSGISPLTQPPRGARTSV